MKSFIRKIFDKEIDDSVHGQFVRFGKGNYEKRAVMKLHKTSAIKVKGSFEYANDFVLLICELVEKLKVSVFTISKIYRHWDHVFNIIYTRQKH